MEHVTSSLAESARELLFSRDRLHVVALTCCIAGLSWAFELTRKGPAPCVAVFCMFYTVHVVHSPRTAPGPLRRWLGWSHQTADDEEEGSEDEDAVNDDAREDVLRGLEEDDDGWLLPGGAEADPHGAVPLAEDGRRPREAASQGEVEGREYPVKDCFTWQDPVLLAMQEMSAAAASALGEASLPAAGAACDGGGAAAEGGAEVGTSMSKSRLDFLLRYMAAAESRHSEQGAVSQRQKLQRKLLLRTAAGGAGVKGEKHQKDPAKDPLAGRGSPRVDEDDQVQDDVFQDSGKIEELIRELGEPRLPAQSSQRGGHSKKAKRSRGSIGKSLPAHNRPPGRAEAAMPRADSDIGAGARAPECADDAAATGAAGAEAGDDGSDGFACSRDVTDHALVGATSVEAISDEGDTTTATGGGAVQGAEVFKKVVTSGRGRRRTRRQEHDLAEASGSGVATTSRNLVDEGDAALATAPAATPAAAAGAAAKAATAAAPAAMQGTPRLGASPERADPIGTEAAVDRVDENAAATVQDDWEWQCPSGHRLVPHICTTAMQCSSCGAYQAEGDSVLLSFVGGWLACEECTRVAYHQPVEVAPFRAPARDASPSPLASTEDPDPWRMSAEEIARWFVQQGAEDTLRRCMLQAVQANKL